MCAATVYHPEGLIRDLMGDVQTYLDSKSIYTDLGIPYRRGYLLAGPPSLIALEDVDCLKVATSRNSKSSEGLTMADLLNVIDGIGASEDRVLFMTANHPETLDAALTRAGRVDRKFCIDYARDEELQSFHSRIARYYPVQPWPEFRAALPARATIADAQALAFQPGTRY